MHVQTKFFFCLFLLWIVSPVFGSNWEWQSPLPQGNPLNDIQIFPGGAGWAVGDGAILRTADGGQTWATCEEWNNGQISNLSFINPDTGWLTTGSGNWPNYTAHVWRSTNGGESWEQQSSLPSALISDLCFLNNQIGIAVGDSSNYNALFRTIDGGYSWTRQIDTVGYGGLDAIEFIDQQEGWIVGHRATLHTTDGGSTWLTVNQEFINLHDAEFFTSRYGFAVSHQHLYCTRNSGCNWYQMQSFPGGSSLYQICFTDSLHGWVAGYGCDLLHTSDGGETWQTQTLNQEIGVLELTCIDTNKAWLVTDVGEIYHTANGGQEWTIQCGQRVTSANIQSISFADFNTGWATAGTWNGNNTIMRSTDGGTNWSVVYYAAAESGINGVFARSSLEAWTMFSGPQIRHTTDGGQTWTIQNVPESGSWGWEDIYFVNADTGWALTGTRIHRTTDNGTTWLTYELPEYITAICMSFVDGLHGWIGGGKPGCIMHTTDGGITWTTQFFDSTDAETVVESISFTDRTNGWACGWYDFALHTTDGGSTWDSVSIEGTYPGCEHVYFTDRNHGWVNNYIGLYYTTDGGNTWTDTHCPIQTVNDMTFLDPDRGWIVGNHGNILRWNNETQAVEPGSPKAIPESCFLTAYPNPFNPVTTLDYSVPRAGRATLKVYDVTGRIVQTLTDRVLLAGSYKVSFNGSGLPSGVYFIRLNGQGFGITHKAVLLK